MYVVSELLNQRFDTVEECQAAEEKFKTIEKEQEELKARLDKIQKRREEVRNQLFGKEENNEDDDYVVHVIKVYML